MTVGTESQSTKPNPSPQLCEVRRELSCTEPFPQQGRKTALLHRSLEYQDTGERHARPSDKNLSQIGHGHCPQATQHRVADKNQCRQNGGGPRLQAQKATGRPGHLDLRSCDSKQRGS